MTYLESGWAPIDELDRAVGLDRGNSSIHVLGHNISAVQQADGLK